MLQISFLLGYFQDILVVGGRLPSDHIIPRGQRDNFLDHIHLQHIHNVIDSLEDSLLKHEINFQSHLPSTFSPDIIKS